MLLFQAGLWITALSGCGSVAKAVVIYTDCDSTLEQQRPPCIGNMVVGAQQNRKKLSITPLLMGPSHS